MLPARLHGWSLLQRSSYFDESMSMWDEVDNKDKEMDKVGQADLETSELSYDLPC